MIFQGRNKEKENKEKKEGRKEDKKKERNFDFKVKSFVKFKAISQFWQMSFNMIFQGRNKEKEKKEKKEGRKEDKKKERKI